MQTRKVYLQASVPLVLDISRVKSPDKKDLIFSGEKNWSISNEYRQHMIRCADEQSMNPDYKKRIFNPKLPILMPVLFRVQDKFQPICGNHAIELARWYLIPFVAAYVADTRQEAQQIMEFFRKMSAVSFSKKDQRTQDQLFPDVFQKPNTFKGKKSCVSHY
jgi:hypothetical protein